MGKESHAVRLAAIVAVVILCLAAVGVSLLDTTGQRLSIVIGFLAPTIVALLALARVRELNGEVQKLQSSVTRAAEQVAPAVADAAARVEGAGAVMTDAADRIEAASHPENETTE